MREISILVIVLEDTSQCNESVFFKFIRISRKKRICLFVTINTEFLIQTYNVINLFLLPQNVIEKNIRCDISQRSISFLSLLSISNTSNFKL